MKKYENFTDSTLKFVLRRWTPAASLCPALDTITDSDPFLRIDPQFLLDSLAVAFMNDFILVEITFWFRS